jgi:hypothetical protein
LQLVGQSYVSDIGREVGGHRSIELGSCTINVVRLVGEVVDCQVVSDVLIYGQRTLCEANDNFSASSEDSVEPPTVPLPAVKRDSVPKTSKTRNLRLTGQSVAIQALIVGC